MKLFKGNNPSPLSRKIALTLAVILLSEIAFPTATFALTSGPSAPEFSSFEPVSTTSMVNEFSGDFTYNIPVINIPGAAGGGYAMSLSYHSGESVESEASWVGYGWTLNPGAINRGKRGFADDTKNQVTYYNDVPANWTASVGGSVGNLELFSSTIPISVNGSIRYNNYRGFGYTAGAGLSIRQGLVTLGYSVSDGSGSFSAQINPASLLKSQKEKKENHEKAVKYKTLDENGRKAMMADEEAAKKKASEDPGAADQAKEEKRKNRESKAISFLSGMGNSYGMYALSDQQKPTTVTPYDGFSFNTSMNLQNNPTPFEAGPQYGFFGNYNIQKNLASVNRAGYGYMYSEEAYNDKEGVMDYYLEKEGTFNKRDRYLSIPFSNADMFSVSGEGMGGGFRMYNKYSGHFRPNSSVGVTAIGQISGDVSLGVEIGGGFSIGLGAQALSVNGDDWGLAGSGNIPDYRFHRSNGADEPYFFRFNEDLGGNVDYDPSNKLVSAAIQVDFGFPGLKTCKPYINPSDVNTSMQSTIDMEGGTKNRSGRSSYIGYHLNGEITGMIGSNYKRTVYAYEKALEGEYVSGGPIDRTNTEQIGEIATINEDGNQYVYGLPVHVKNETSLQYDLQGVAAGMIESNFVAYKNTLSPYKMKVGEVNRGSYATSYLLTQISTPDYVDRTMNGPSLDDFGGYTRFKYTQLYNAATNAYHFRAPYTGLNYGKGDMTDPSDDMGSYSSGDKDVYYLDQIVTKTHIAKFIASDRFDGLDAASEASASANATAKGTKKLKKLDRIELWTVDNNGDPEKLVKKVIFKYDYSLCQNVANTSSITPGQKGKLTLKELWFEYDGIVSAKISPYKFTYKYPDIASTYPAAYQFPGYSGLNENPDYDDFAVDGWGNYQDAATAAVRFANLKTGVNQTPPPTFDPAAWQLKVITLPSGGEIHVEYEQDDYLYVQNRRAMSLVSLIPATAGRVTPIDPSITADPIDLTGLYPGSYILNVEDIGIITGSPTEAAEKQQLVNLINQSLTDDKVYFKFLYAMLGTTAGIGQCNSDYISGYLNFRKAYLSTTNDVVIQIGDPGSPDYVFPRQVCLDKMKKEKGGNMNAFGNCDASSGGVPQGGSVEDIVTSLLSMITTLPGFAELSSCLAIRHELSYFKIPVLKPKKGGGLRVKRILMYDANGIDNGIQSLYGTEYFYQNENGESSGVSTNEPSALRDENALISFLPKRTEQDFLSKVISGADQAQFEGPIGESLLPSASVGYSRVVSKNIHSGKTNTGFTVSEFFTVKEYPFDMTYNGTNGISSTTVDTENDWMNLPAIVLNYNVSNVWAAQGYRFILNSMHGQPRSVASYAGDYTGGALTTFYKSSSTEYEYVKPGDPVSVQRPDGSIVPAYPGKDMEVAFEMKQVEDITADASVEVDFGAGMAGIIPLPQASLSPLINYNESRMRTHVTSKVIRFPVIRKAVISSQNGIVHRTENVVYSAYTGEPVITKTTDGYHGLNLPSDNPHNGTYTSYNIPAWSQYPEMGQKAINERAFILGTDVPGTTLQSSPYRIVFPVSNSPAVCDALKNFTRGDLIRIDHTGSADPQYFHVDNITGNVINLLLTAGLNPTASTGTIISIEIVRSGRTNQLTETAGGYVTYGNSSVTGATVFDLTNKLNFVSQLNTGLAGVIGGGPPYEQTFGELCISPKAASIKLTNSPDEGGINIQTFLGVTPVCGGQVPFSATGQFFLDMSTGQVKYRTYPGACFSYDVTCATFCNGMTPATVSKVISSSATIYDFQWPYDATKYVAPPVLLSYNAYENGEKGKWRPKENYVFKTSIVGGAVYPAELNHKDAGTYLLTMFNWKNPALNATTNWVRSSTVTMYSPNGEALEEKDAIDIFSAAKFGYNNMLPYLVAGNTNYANVLFESFEKMYNNTKFEDGLSGTSSQWTYGTAHSGKSSYKLPASGSLNLNPVTTNAQLQTSGLSIKVWVKDPAHAANPLKGQLTAGTSIPLSFKKIAQTGQWTLYEAVAKNLVLSTVYTPQLTNNLAADIWIDDVKQQPLDAKMTTYVYDTKTLRLLTSFDDQHFGLYYQYNQEGKLVRKMIETEKGMKTVSETQYHTPSVVPTPGLY